MSLVTFRPPGMHPFDPLTPEQRMADPTAGIDPLYNQGGGQYQHIARNGGYGPAAQAAAGGAGGRRSPGRKPFAMPGGNSMLATPMAGYRAAWDKLGMGPMSAAQEAMEGGDLGSAAAVEDMYRQQREQEQRANRASSMKRTSEQQSQYLNDPNLAGSDRILQQLIANPEVLSQAVQAMMLSRGAQANRGARMSQEGAIRENLGGEGAAFMQAMLGAQRDEAGANQGLSRDIGIEAAERNFRSAMDVQGAARNAASQRAADQVPFWDSLNTLENANIRMPEMPFAGLAQLAAFRGEGGGGGGAGGGVGVAPGMGGDMYGGLGDLVNSGGSYRYSGHQNDNFGGIQLTDPTGEYRRGMAASGGGPGGNSTIRTRNGQRQFQGRDGKWYVDKSERGYAPERSENWVGHDRDNGGGIPGISIPDDDDGGGMSPELMDLMRSLTPQQIRQLLGRQ